MSAGVAYLPRRARGHRYGAKAAQARLISVLNTFSSDVGAVRDALNKGDVAQIRVLQGRVVSDVGGVQSAAKELQNKAG